MMLAARNSFLGTLLGLAGIICVSSCTNSGVQGTSLFKSFRGLEAAVPLSPTAVRLQWTLDSSYSAYKVYQDQSLSPIATEQFANRTVTGLIPGSNYVFEVTGVKVDGTEEVLAQKLAINTYQSFEGLKAAGVNLKSPTEVSLTWSLNADTADYKVYYKKQGEAFDLSLPAGTVRGENEFIATGLTSGQTYCFFLQAHYLDATKEPLALTSAEADASASCVQLTSNIQELPSISVSSMVPGEFPWFWASSGNPAYKIDIFDLSSNVRVASRTGNGTFRSFVRVPAGASQYYAQVSDNVGIANVTVNIDGKQDLTASKVRSFATSGSKGPIKPQLMNDGNGQQNLGKTLAAGDFNCDGLQDVAMGLPSSTIISSTNHYRETGAVAIYYSYRSPGPCFDASENVITCPAELVTNGEPSIAAQFPNPQLITYPATSNFMRIGSQLTVGNFNGDCYERTPGNLRNGSCNSLFGPTIPLNRLPNIKSCDDLAVGFGSGEINIIYGNPSQGLVSGSGANTAGLNEFTCDSTSNTCRVGRFTPGTGYRTGAGFPRAMSAGDFNNDGFDELAVSAETSVTPSKVEVIIYRGGGLGLYPQGATGSHAPLRDSTNGVSTFGALVFGMNSDDFGDALGTVFDSRRCVNGTPGPYVYRPSQPVIRKGYDFTKCDDLVIGAPGRKSASSPSLDRGSIFSCKGRQDDGTDRQRINDWICAEHFPAELVDKEARYGSVIHGVRNLMGYPILNILSNPSNPSFEVPELAGALFVGAPALTIDYGGQSYSGAGKVYGYYVTPLSTDTGNGGLTGVLGNSSLGHQIEAQNSLACNKLNADKQTGSLYHCKHQGIYMSPPEAGANFGAAISSFAVNDAQALTEESPKWLAVGAPYKDGSGPGGASVGGTGAIYLYRPDVSNFGNEGATPILQAQRSYGTETSMGCTTTCTWYSGGVSPFGPSLFTIDGLATNSNFGLAGAVGGDFNDDGEADMISSAPNSNLPSPKNGGVYLFHADVGFNPTVNTASVSLLSNVSLEGNYDFQELKSVGDINGDGYDDAATHVNANGTWNLNLYYGSAQGLIQTPAPSLVGSGNLPLLLRSSSDSGFGKNFFPAGDVNGDGYADLVIVGDSATYVYYGSSTGLVTTPAPSISPIGKGPIEFAKSTFSNDTLSFSGDSKDVWGSPSQLNSAVYNSIVQAITSGDYNNDGYDDLAFRVQISVNPPVPSANLNLGTNQNGRVVIVYGSLIGPQVNRLTGTIRWINAGNAPDVVVEDPCSSTAPIICKVQILGPPHSSSTSSFGFALTSIHRQDRPTHALYDRLVVSEPGRSSNAGTVYIFDGGPKGIKAEVLQTLIPKPGLTNQVFGFQIINAGDLNGDDYLDLVVSTAHTTTSQAYVFYGANVGGVIGYFGASGIATTDYWGTSLAVNGQHSVATEPRPQIIRPTTIASGEFFGWGMAAFKDFNNDGYGDVAFNVPNGDSTIAGTITDAGFSVIYFGSLLGLQSSNVVMSPFPRCFRGVTPLCEPYQLLLPGSVLSENSHINPHSVGDFDGDGFEDLAIGGIGRDLVTPGKRTATSAGVIYVVY